MNILHLTDFHYSTQATELNRQTRVVSKIIEHIKSQQNKPDFILFTGDLVFSGANIDSFNKAKDALIDPLLKEFDLTYDRFIICPGNHDVDRNKKSKAIIDHIDSITSNKELDKFAKEHNIDYKNSLLPLKNYNDFVKGLYEDGDDIFQNGYSCQIREFNGKKVGFYAANTAWRAVGDNDEGKLVIPLKFIDEGLHYLHGCDFKIILHHHPISDFKLFNQYSLEDLIHNNFNIAFSGHLHKDTASIFFTHTDGILKIQSAATLAGIDGSTIGYSQLSVDLEAHTVSGMNYKFNNENEFFYDANKIDAQIPITKEKQEQNKFRQRLRDLYEIELGNADDLFLNGKVNKESKGFLDLWTAPVISSKSPEEVRKENTVLIFDCKDFLTTNSDYLILGEDKCGKTSLLKYLQLQCLSNYSNFETIPYYIDSKKIDKGKDVQGKIQRDLATYYATSKAGALQIMEKQKTLILIDNLDLSEEDERAWLEEVVNSFKFGRILVCCNENSVTKYSNVTIGNKKMVNIFFHSLKKKQIREIAEKFYGVSNVKIEVITRINHIFNMLAIPFNFWNVSLFMWVFKESSRDITNDVDLVDLYMESILERENLLRKKGEFSYDKYKQYLAHLAKFMLKKHDTSYAANIADILKFTDEYLKGNPRNNTDARTVWAYVESKGIVKEVSAGMYAFRLNGIFEYFLAHYLKLDEKFRNEIILDDNVYLSFKNELEMYAGSNRSDEAFVERIFDKTKGIFSNLHEHFSDVNIDEMLKSVATDGVLLPFGKNEMAVIAERMSQDELDDFEDSVGDSSMISRDRHCEVRVKQLIPIDQEDVVSLERDLYILGRVFKNADDIKNGDLINEIFDYLLKTTVMWGFKLFESMQRDTNENKEEKDHLQMIATLMKQLLPIIVQSRVSDMIGAHNMQGIVKNKIAAINSFDDKYSQFQLFVLIYLLCDIDLGANYQLIEESSKRIKLPILKHSIMLKILYYYHFKISELPTQQQKLMEKNLQNYYAEVGRSFNNSVYTKNSINQMFTNLDKKRMIEGSKNR